jgi:dimethylglycine dehydrogenase
MWSCDPRRYTDYADHDYCLQKALETYGHEYGMHFPYKEWPAGRDKKHSTLHSRLQAAGAVFGAYNGWERANWFAQPGDDTSEAATLTWERDGPWHARVAEEAQAVRDHCGMLAITGFSRLAVEGPGARAHVDSLTVSRLPQPGRVGLAYFADERGRIVTEMSAIPRSDDSVWLITAALAQWHDKDVLTANVPDGVTVSDRTDKYECILVTGPKARDILSPLTDADLTLGWLSAQEARVCGQDVMLLRVSFAGELGWEVHCAPEAAPVIWDALANAGVKPFGMYALDSLRIEKGYRGWKQDLSSGYSVLEAGLDRFVDFEKNKDFPGRAALLAEREAGVAKQAVGLVVDANGLDAPYMSALWKDGDLVGETTSGGWGHRVGASLAIGMLRSDLTEPGTVVEVDIFGERHTATVHTLPFWDPKNERLRA